MRSLVAGQQDTQSILTTLVAVIQQRWGNRALWWGTRHTPHTAVFATGFVALDTLLGGGIPRGTITELLGAPTSGMATIALRTLAHAQQAGHLGAYIDLGSTFDAAYAAACGVNLSLLLVVRPISARDLVDLVLALAEQDAIGVLIIDSLALLQASGDGATLLLRSLPALIRTLARSSCVVIALTPLPYTSAMIERIAFRGSILAEHAALRLHIGAGDWDTHDPACPQRRSRVLVLKQRGTQDGQQTDVVIAFPDAGGQA